MVYSLINELQPFDDHEFDIMFDHFTSDQPRIAETRPTTPTTIPDRRTELCAFIARVIIPERYGAADTADHPSQHARTLE